MWSHVLVAWSSSAAITSTKCLLEAQTNCCLQKSASWEAGGASEIIVKNLLMYQRICGSLGNSLDTHLQKEKSSFILPLPLHTSLENEMDLEGFDGRPHPDRVAVVLKALHL